MKCLLDSYEKIQKEFVADRFRKQEMLMVICKDGDYGFTDKKKAMILIVPQKYRYVMVEDSSKMLQGIKIFDDDGERINITGYLIEDNDTFACFDNGCKANKKYLDYFPNCSFYQHTPYTPIICKQDDTIIGCVLPIKR